MGGSLIQLEPSANWRVDGHGEITMIASRVRKDEKENSRDIWRGKRVRCDLEGVESCWVEVGGERSSSSRGEA